MKIQLTVVYDLHDNFTVHDADGEEIWCPLSQPCDEVATYIVRLNFPDVQPKVAAVEIPQSDNPVTVTIS